MLTGSEMLMHPNSSGIFADLCFRLLKVAVALRQQALAIPYTRKGIADD